MKLPLECEAEYFKDFIDLDSANQLFIELSELIKDIDYTPTTEDGKKHEVTFGKIMFLDQNLVDENKFPEHLWGASMPWPKNMKSLKAKIEKFTNHKFETCVLMYYPNGASGVDFHSDFTAFGDTSFIPSISLGEERTFKLRHKESGEVFTILLKNGSLITMGKHCQERYEHSLPIDIKYRKARINLTFRKYGFGG